MSVVMSGTTLFVSLYLTKTFVVETLYYCNLLCYVKCSTSLLTFEAIAISLYHIITNTAVVATYFNKADSGAPYKSS